MLCKIKGMALLCQIIVSGLMFSLNGDSPPPPTHTNVYHAYAYLVLQDVPKLIARDDTDRSENIACGKNS